jgi:hypothetical protein
MIRWTLAMWMSAIVALAVGSAVVAEAADALYPKLVTAETRKNAETPAALERPGNVFFRDGFQSPESLMRPLGVAAMNPVVPDDIPCLSRLARVHQGHVLAGQLAVMNVVVFDDMSRAPTVDDGVPAATERAITAILSLYAI